MRVTYQICLDRRVPQPLNDERQEHRESLARDTGADIERQNVPQLPVSCCLNHVATSKSVLFDAIFTVRMTGVAIVVLADAVGSKTALLERQKPRRARAGGQPRPGDEASEDCQGAFDDEEVLPVFQGSVEVEDAVGWSKGFSRGRARVERCLGREKEFGRELFMQSCRTVAPRTRPGDQASPHEIVPEKKLATTLGARDIEKWFN